MPVLHGPGTVLIVKVTGASIVKGDLLIPAADGKLTKATFDSTSHYLEYMGVAIALESQDASSVDKELVAISLI